MPQAAQNLKGEPISFTGGLGKAEKTASEHATGANSDLKRLSCGEALIIDKSNVSSKNGRDRQHHDLDVLQQVCICTVMKLDCFTSV